MAKLKRDPWNRDGTVTCRICTRHRKVSDFAPAQLKGGKGSWSYGYKCRECAARYSRDYSAGLIPGTEPYIRANPQQMKFDFWFDTWDNMCVGENRRAWAGECALNASPDTAPTLPHPIQGEPE